MSYILDALRRADSERERGDVPGLHTHPVPVNDADPDSERRPRLWIGLAAAVFVVLLAAVAWLLLERSSAPDLALAPAPAASMATAAVATPPVPATPAAQAAAEADRAASQPDAPPQPMASTGSPAAAADRPGRTDAPARDRTARSPAGDARSTQVSPARTAATQKPPPKAAPTPKPTAPANAPGRESESRPRIYTLNELPEEIRRALPATSVNGSVYSRSAASRMVVINGQVFHEGDELADQLVLEEIRQKSAVLRFKGFRYLINYP